MSTHPARVLSRQLSVPLACAALALMTILASHAAAAPAVKPGIQVLLEEPEFFALVKGKSIGLITNPTGVDANLVSTIDLLHRHPEVKLVALFGPEHGVRGDAYAGQKVADDVDPKTGVKIFSLYGKTRRPPPEFLEGVEVLVYDIQDVGSRSYTYIYTMAYAMEAAADKGIPFVVLDRPNPAGAQVVDGNAPNPMQYKTFVGLYPIAYQYGMTPGEAALMFNKEHNAKACELHVVPMRGYTRDMWQRDTGLPFVPTSTHIPRADVSTYYNLTGIVGELKGISIGVGYTLPFEVIAAPWIDREKLTDALVARKIPGLGVRPISFEPRYAAFSTTKDGKPEMCHGVQLFITDYNALQPVTAQVHIIVALQALYADKNLFSDEAATPTLFDEVWGTEAIRKMVLAGKSAEEIIASWQGELEAFKAIRAKYLLYPEVK